MDHLKGQFPEIFGVIIFKSRIALRATEQDRFGPGGPYDLQILQSQFAECFLIPAPEGVVSAAPFIIADHRFNSDPVQQGQGTPGAVQRRNV